MQNIFDNLEDEVERFLKSLNMNEDENEDSDEEFLSAFSESFDNISKLAMALELKQACRLAETTNRIIRLMEEKRLNMTADNLNLLILANHYMEEAIETEVSGNEPEGDFHLFINMLESVAGEPKSQQTAGSIEIPDTSLNDNFDFDTLDRIISLNREITAFQKQFYQSLNDLPAVPEVEDSLKHISTASQRLTDNLEKLSDNLEKLRKEAFMAEMEKFDRYNLFINSSADSTPAEEDETRETAPELWNQVKNIIATARKTEKVDSDTTFIKNALKEIENIDSLSFAISDEEMERLEAELKLFDTDEDFEPNINNFPIPLDNETVKTIIDLQIPPKYIQGLAVTGKDTSILLLSPSAFI